MKIKFAFNYEHLPRYFAIAILAINILAISALALFAKANVYSPVYTDDYQTEMTGQNDEKINAAGFKTVIEKINAKTGGR